MATPAITVERLGKEYTLGEKEQYLTMRDLLAQVVKAPLRLINTKSTKNTKKAQRKPQIWALQDISFTAEKGEVIGIIGRNGAGKSTLLKIVTGITEPSVGKVTLTGRVASLLEVGTGFHPELTGRENIYLNGAILGMSKREITTKFKEIVEFSGIERFLDTPVKRYSSGMYVRLAFAVAAHLDPEILLVDEVLAVGDIEFQRKCLGKMKNVVSGGRTVLFVSHNMGAIKHLCNRCILLDKGRIVKDDSSEVVIKEYYRIMNQNTDKYARGLLHERTERSGTGQVRVVNIEVTNLNGSLTIKSGDKIKVKVDYVADNTYANANLILSFVAHPEGNVLFRCRSINLVGNRKLRKKGTITCSTDSLNLAQGRIHINTGFFIGGVLADYVEEAIAFDLIDDNYLGYPCQDSRSDYASLIKHRWEFR